MHFKITIFSYSNFLFKYEHIPSPILSFIRKFLDFVIKNTACRIEWYMSESLKLYGFTMR